MLTLVRVRRGGRPRASVGALNHTNFRAEQRRHTACVSHGHAAGRGNLQCDVRRRYGAHSRAGSGLGGCFESACAGSHAAAQHKPDRRGDGTGSRRRRSLHLLHIPLLRCGASPSLRWRHSLLYAQLGAVGVHPSTSADPPQWDVELFTHAGASSHRVAVCHSRAPPLVTAASTGDEP